jgi:hypothetical protein
VEELFAWKTDEKNIHAVAINYLDWFEIYTFSLYVSQFGLHKSVIFVFKWEMQGFHS